MQFCVTPFSEDLSLVQDRGTPIQEPRLQWEQNFVWLCLVLVGPQYGTCLMSPSSCRNFEMAFRFFEQVCTSAVRKAILSQIH
jgi:hypothetical protein